MQDAAHKKRKGKRNLCTTPPIVSKENNRSTQKEAFFDLTRPHVKYGGVRKKKMHENGKRGAGNTKEKKIGKMHRTNLLQR